MLVENQLIITVYHNVWYFLTVYSNNTTASTCLFSLFLISYVKYLLGDKVPIEPFVLNSILPSDLSRYYRYGGSLTNPPCFESVIWTVFEDTVKISERQVIKHPAKMKFNLYFDLTDGSRVFLNYNAIYFNYNAFYLSLRDITLNYIINNRVT